MTFNWQDYLDISKYLTMDDKLIPSEEAKFRTAVSRAYYASFNSCREFAEKHLNFTTSKGENSHEKLIDFLLTTKSNKLINEIGYKLKLIKKDRIVSDYSGVFKNYSSQTITNIFLADEIQEILEKVSLLTRKKI
ncbi:MAG: hypothetical protein HQM10_26945 [Candidatus Riflebacteria bacterium]|nr:hypothetical protein [Candidatus Riflebacteria bacterium]